MKQPQKNILIATASIVALIGAAATTVVLLQHFMPKDTGPSKEALGQSIIETDGKTLQDEADKALATGDLSLAISKLKAAKDLYQKRPGNELIVQDIDARIGGLEAQQKAQPTAEPQEAPAQPLKIQ